MAPQGRRVLALKLSPRKTGPRAPGHLVRPRGLTRSGLRRPPPAVAPCLPLLCDVHAGEDRAVPLPHAGTRACAPSSRLSQGLILPFNLGLRAVAPAWVTGPHLPQEEESLTKGKPHLDLRTENDQTGSELNQGHRRWLTLRSRRALTSGRIFVYGAPIPDQGPRQATPLPAHSREQWVERALSLQDR